MENLILRKQIRNVVFCLASGGVLAACGGDSSSAPAANDTRLLANGEACSPAWVASQVYLASNKVSYAGRNYSAAYFSQGSNPSTNSGAVGSGQAWITGFLCGSVTTTTRTTTSSFVPNTGTQYPPTTSSTTSSTKTSTTTSSSIKATTQTSGTSPTNTLATRPTTTTTTTTTKPVGTASCKPYVAGTTYVAGQIVTNAGGYYSCTVGGWCSSGAPAYEPGVGWAWNTAWSTNNGSTCAPATTTTTTLPPAQPCWAPWSSTTSYMAGAKVSYNHVNYTGAFFTQYLNPSTNSGPAGSGQPWVVSGPCY